MITSPQAIKFSNEYARPLAELIREFRIRAMDANQKWTEIQALVPNSASETVEDARENEGVSKLTGQDLNTLMTVNSAMLAAVTQFAVINKHCVRAIQVVS